MVARRDGEVEFRVPRLFPRSRDDAAAAQQLADTVAALMSIGTSACTAATLADRDENWLVSVRGDLSVIKGLLACPDAKSDRQLWVDDTGVVNLWLTYD
ncbi:hypothetical protein MOQ72_25720 [Saccharopolyspora sp. K220]|uniref:hypothetical protein n=1 Tax=Saccharopolyspora soli TaxID=2926618 RepID=UPI001F5854FB|nr:hypothetical protein [Saccharopolyspora soli]MCI2420853.1 hypothetical protein [Saccharopolyspora soli]